jgi:hypothetical protein
LGTDDNQLAIDLAQSLPDRRLAGCINDIVFPLKIDHSLLSGRRLGA